MILNNNNIWQNAQVYLESVTETFFINVEYLFAIKWLSNLPDYHVTGGMESLMALSPDGVSKESFLKSFYPGKHRSARQCNHCHLEHLTILLPFSQECISIILT